MLNRFDGNVVPFASEATLTNRTVFGAETQSDDIDDNLNADFKKGWEIVGLNDNPTREDFNAMGYTLGNLISYLYQNGVAEYNVLQEYKTNSIAIATDGSIYQSLVDDNIGNALTDATKWICIASKNSIVNNIDELKTISNIEAVNILGYYTKGDGGGGTFYWDSTSTETDNGGTIIQATGVTTGRWKRVFSGAINIKWFGAKGDGINDDTLAIQKSINYLSNDTYIYAPEYSNGGTVFIPNGKFRVTDTIYLTRGVKLKGNLSSASFGYVPTNNSNSISVIFGDFTEENKIIIDTATYIVDTHGHVPSNSLLDGVDVTNKVVTQTHAVAIEDICVYGNGVAMTAIRLISSPLASVNNVLINGGVDYGIILQACWGVSFDNCNIIASKVGAAIINSCHGFSSTGVYTSTSGASLDVSEVPYFYQQDNVGNPNINPLQVYTARVGIYISDSNGVLNSPINEQSTVGMVLRNSRVTINSPHWEQLVYVMAFTCYSQVEFNSVTALHANKKLMYAGTGSQINFTVANISSNQYLDYFEYYSFQDSMAVIDGARKSGELDSIGSIRFTQREYPAKAWAQFDGGLTPYIRYSKNIGSITRLNTGHLHIAFVNPMPDTNYAVNATAGNFTYMAPGTISQITWGKPTVNGFEISVTNADGLPINADLISVSVYR